MQRYLSLSEVANLIGVAPDTAKGYLREGRLPPPDAMTGRTRGWLKQTILDWNAARPGQGAREDLRRRSRTSPAPDAAV